MIKRRISVVTGSRAEYGILKPLLERIIESNDLELYLIVTGMHLLKRYGSTINEIKKDHFKVKAIVRMYDEREKDASYFGKALSKGISNFTSLFSNIDPDILVVLGDRLEPLAATLGAVWLRIPVAHIHGGDKTNSGHIDESIRHAISRFAHIHFPAADSHVNRLIKTGEEPWRIFKSGALGLDSIIGQQLIAKKELSAKLNLELDKETIICIFHPVHLERETMAIQMHEILEAIKALRIQTSIIYPNNDAASRDIISEIEKYKNLSFIRIFPNLSHLEYISLLRYAGVLIGNSSSGIIEAPSLKLGVVNIGSRNTGREYAENVIFISAEKHRVINAIKKVLYDKKFKEQLKWCKNPYGDGRASERIVKVLSSIKLDKKLLQKQITY